MLDVEEVGIAQAACYECRSFCARASAGSANRLTDEEDPTGGAAALLRGQSACLPWTGGRQNILQTQSRLKAGLLRAFGWFPTLKAELLLGQVHKMRTVLKQLEAWAYADRCWRYNWNVCSMISSCDPLCWLQFKEGAAEFTAFKHETLWQGSVQPLPAQS